MQENIGWVLGVAVLLIGIFGTIGTFIIKQVLTESRSATTAIVGIQHDVIELRRDMNGIGKKVGEMHKEICSIKISTEVIDQRCTLYNVARKINSN